MVGEFAKTGNPNLTSTHVERGLILHARQATLCTQVCCERGTHRMTRTIVRTVFWASALLLLLTIVSLR